MDLFNGKNLDGWESIGDGVWTVMRDGTLLGLRGKTWANLGAYLSTAAPGVPTSWPVSTLNVAHAGLLAIAKVSPFPEAPEALG